MFRVSPINPNIVCPCRMRCMLLLVALVAGVRGYVQLVEVDYKQLQDRSGMLTLNASTYNRVAFDDGANTLYVLGRGRFVFTLECFSFRHSCAKLTVIPRPTENLFCFCFFCFLFLFVCLFL